MKCWRLEFRSDSRSVLVNQRQQTHRPGILSMFSAFKHVKPGRAAQPLAAEADQLPNRPSSQVRKRSHSSAS